MSSLAPELATFPCVSQHWGLLSHGAALLLFSRLSHRPAAVKLILFLILVSLSSSLAPAHSNPIKKKNKQENLNWRRAASSWTYKNSFRDSPYPPGVHSSALGTVGTTVRSAVKWGAWFDSSGGRGTTGQRPRGGRWGKIYSFIPQIFVSHWSTNITHSTW